MCCCVSSGGGATVLAGCLGLFELHALVQGSPRDSENDGKGLLPKMQSINWNQDLSGTAISQYETFDSSDSTDGAGRGESLRQATLNDPAAFSIRELLPDVLEPVRVTSCAGTSQPEVCSSAQRTAMLSKWGHGSFCGCWPC